MRHKHPLNSNTPDQTAARIFEHRLKDHVQKNPACQWELDWYKSLKKVTRRHRTQIDQQLANQAATGKPLCDLLISELAKPTQAFELQSPISPALSDQGHGEASSSSGYFPTGEVSAGSSALSPGADSSNEEHGEKLGMEGPKTPTSADIGSPTVPETQSSKPDNVVLSSPFDEAGKPRARTSKFPGAFLASVSSLDSGVSSENPGTHTSDAASSPTQLPLSIDDISPTLHVVPPSPTSGSGGAHLAELPQQSDVSPDPVSDFTSEAPLESRHGLRLVESQTHTNSSEPGSAGPQQVPGAYRSSVYSLDVASSTEDVIESPSSQRTATEVDWKVPGQVTETQDAHISRDTDSIKSEDTIGSPARPPADTLDSQSGATQESDVSQTALVTETGDLDPQTNSVSLEKRESSQPDEAPEPNAQDVRDPEIDAPATSRDSIPHDANDDDALANPATSQSVISESAPRVEPAHPSDSPQPDAEIPHASENHPPDLPTDASTKETDGDVSGASPGPPGTKAAEDLEPVRHAEPRTEPPAIAVPSAEIAPGPENHPQTSPEDAAVAPTHEAGDGAPRALSDPVESGPTKSTPEQPLPNAPQSTDLLESDTAIAPGPGNPPPTSLDDFSLGTDPKLSQPDFTTSEGTASESPPDPKPSADTQPEASLPSETSELAAKIVQEAGTSLAVPPSISQDLSTPSPSEDQTNQEAVENREAPHPTDVPELEAKPIEESDNHLPEETDASQHVPEHDSPEPAALEATLPETLQPSDEDAGESKQLSELESDPVPASPAAPVLAPTPGLTVPTSQSEPQANISTSTEPKIEESPPSPVLTPSDKIAKEAGVAAQRFTDYGIIDDLDDAIDLYGRVAELLSNGSEQLDPSSYLDLGRMMRVKFEAYSEIADLESAIDNALMKALNLAPEGHKLYPDVLFELAAALLARYIYDGENSAAEKTQKYCHDALGSIPSGPRHAAFHSILGKIHLTRFEYLGDHSDAEQAIACAEKALEVEPARVDQANYHDELSRALLASSRIEALRDIDGDLNRALEHAERALSLTSPATVQFPIASTLLADVLLTRYNRSHNRSELDRALELLEAAVKVVPYISPEQPWISEPLGLALVAKFEADGSNEDLDDAIEFHKNAANLTVFNRYRRRDRLRTLSESLRLRYQRFNNAQDLTDADDSLEKSERAMSVAEVS